MIGGTSFLCALGEHALLQLLRSEFHQVESFNLKLLLGEDPALNGEDLVNPSMV